MKRNYAVLGLLVLLMVVIFGVALLVNTKSTTTGNESVPTPSSAPEPITYCGDAVCSIGETTFTCSMDCGLAVDVTPNPLLDTPTAVPASEPPNGG
jgi:hypothetical protein